MFTYDGSSHSVDEVSQADYTACNFDNKVSSDSSGSTSVTFDKAGTRYFACATPLHCDQGQKVAITVSAGAGASPSPPQSQQGGGQSPPPPPKGNSAAAGAGAGLGAKLALGLGLGGALLAAF